MTVQRFIERLIWWCLLPLIAAGALLAGAQAITLEKRRDLLADSLLRSVARAMDHTLDVQIKGLELLAWVINDRGEIPDRPDLAVALERAQRFAALSGWHVMLANSRSDVLLNTRDPERRIMHKVPQPQGRNSLELTLLSGRPEVGNLFYGPVAQAAVISVSIPTPGTSAGERLALVSTVEAASIQKRLGAIEVPPGWALAVLDSTRHPIAKIGTGEGPWASSAAGPTPSAPSSSASGPSAFGPSASGASAVDADRARFLRVVRLNEAPWTVELYAPDPGPGAGWIRDGLLLACLLVGAAGVAYMGGRIASRRLTHSLRTLAEVAANPSAPAPPSAADIEEVALARERLRTLHREREQAQETERRRIGLELHDDLQQKLAVLRNDLVLLKDQLPTDSQQARQTTQGAVELVTDAIDSTRRLIDDLRPIEVDEHGLVIGIKGLLARLKNSAGVSGDLQLIGPMQDVILPPMVSTALYRIAQEALNNVLKHAQAQTVHLSLDCSDPHAWVLEIVDDGKGFAAEGREPRPGHGLAGMTERAHSVGGSVEVRSASNEGTALIVRIPRLN